MLTAGWPLDAQRLPVLWPLGAGRGGRHGKTWGGCVYGGRFGPSILSNQVSSQDSAIAEWMLSVVVDWVGGLAS
eukprot:84809-Chlamydomonas_euryale.AAC.1